MEQNHQQGIDPANKPFNASHQTTATDLSKTFTNIKNMSFRPETQRTGEIRFSTVASKLIQHRISPLPVPSGVIPENPR
jgi:hypothetical protein